MAASDVASIFLVMLFIHSCLKNTANQKVTELTQGYPEYPLFHLGQVKRMVCCVLNSTLSGKLRF